MVESSLPFRLVAPSPAMLKRVRTQLALQVTPDLLARVKAAAASQGRTVTYLAMQWLEEGLAGTSAPSPAPHLLQRLQRLEARVQRLEGASSAVASVPESPLLDAPLLDTAVPPEGLESREVARSLRISRGTFNARIDRAGGAREGLVINGWRCLGTFPPPPGRGGPKRPRWVRDA